MATTEWADVPSADGAELDFGLVFMITLTVVQRTYLFQVTVSADRAFAIFSQIL